MPQREWKPKKPRPSGTGPLLFLQRGDQILIQSWPRKRGKNQTLTEKQNGAYFRAVQQAFKTLHPVEWASWLKLTDRGRLYPRDLYTASVYGRGHGFKIPGLHTIMPNRARYDVSKSLDVLSEDVGSVLVRASPYWEARPLGQPGQVLTVTEEPPFVDWQDPPIPSITGGGIVEPINMPKVPFGNTVADDYPAATAGRVIALPGYGTAGQWLRREFSAPFSAGTITAGFHTYMSPQAQSIIGIYARANNTGWRYGLRLSAESNNTRWLQAFFSNTNTGIGSAFNAQQIQWPSPIFLRIQYNRPNMVLFAGPDRNELLEIHTFSFATWTDVISHAGYEMINRAAVRPGTIARFIHFEVT